LKGSRTSGAWRSAPRFSNMGLLAIERGPA